MKKLFIVILLAAFLLPITAKAIPWPWGPPPFPSPGFTAEVIAKEAAVKADPNCTSRTLAVIREGDIVFLTGEFENGYVKITTIISDGTTSTVVEGWIFIIAVFDRGFELPNGKEVGPGQGDRTESCIASRG